MIDAHTRLCGVLGHPVAHSVSPAIQNAALRHAGVNAVYLAMDVRPSDLGSVIAGLHAAGAIGVNVTVPHKVAALELARVATDEAVAVGAANTLVFGEDGVLADNTDVAGFRRAVHEAGLRVAGSRCVVLGAGGGARAAAWALLQDGAGSITVANRTAVRAAALVEALRRGGADADLAEWPPDISGALVVNATSIGLDGTSSPLDPATLPGCAGVFDLVYGAQTTPLVRAARDAGLEADDGLGMLVHQAAAAFVRFTGLDAPLEVMRDAAWRAAGRTPRPTGDADDLPALI